MFPISASFNSIHYLVYKIKLSQFILTRNFALLFPHLKLYNYNSLLPLIDRYYNKGHTSKYLKIKSSNLNNNNNIKMEQNHDFQFQADFLSFNVNNSTENQNLSISRNQQETLSSQPTNSSSHFNYTETVNKIRLFIENIRKWDYSNLGSEIINKGQKFSSDRQIIFSVLSYNILAQSLLEDHMYLYGTNEKRSLNWEHRKQLILTELKESQADIICLQEVQESYISIFTHFFNDLNYEGYFKRRTNDKPDGVAIYFKKNKFKLIDMITVEYNQPGITILNRDNVGLILRLAPLNMPQQNLIVSTTHLLYNPNRHDVKLAQLQLLFAEIDRIAFRFTNGKHARVYWPIIFTGDLNLDPNSPLYEFITKGYIKFVGLSSKTLLKDDGKPLYNNILPEELGITDMCFHEELNSTRKNNQQLNSSQTQQFIKVYNTETSTIGEQANISYKEYVDKIRQDGLMNNFIPLFKQTLSIAKNSDSNYYNSGRLTHWFHFRSVYKSRHEVTTFQNKWTCVDYIFYSCHWNRQLQKSIEGKLKLLGKYQLPNEKQAKDIGPIPNLAIPSDHYPLLATFLLQI